MIRLTCGITAAGLAWILLAPREREPSYQGRTLSQWYAQWAKSVEHEDDVELTAQCVEATAAIRQIGTNALPTLLNQLKRQASPSPVRVVLWALVNRLPRSISQSHIVGSLLDADKVGPSSTFIILGPQAAPAVPELERFLVATNTPSLIHSAVYCLAAIGDAGLPPLLDALADPQHPARYEVAYWLGVGTPFSFGTNLSQAVPLLAQCITATDPLLTEAAVRALGHIHQEPQVAIPALASCLTSTNFQGYLMIRFKAGMSLASFGQVAVAPLEAALNHSDEIVRRIATNSLQLIAQEVLTNAPSQ